MTDGMHKATARKLEQQRKFLSHMRNTTSIASACRKSGFSHSTVTNWMNDDIEFRRTFDKLKAEQKVRKGIVTKDDDLVYDQDKDLPDPMPFGEWRQHYLGRPVTDAQKAIIRAYEDKTNRHIFVLGPTGMGKDTTAGDLLLKEVTQDRGLRTAWIMETEPLSRRRIAERLVPYLTDQKVYTFQPRGPGTSRPEGSLITDFGPFQWKKGMVDPNGNSIEATTWTKNEVYFIRSQAPEADPNLWATGMGGKIYGSRIDLLVCSDLFTRENQRSPVTMDEQYYWLLGTIDSRLDDQGRVVFIGTRAKKGDNYERLMDRFVGSAPVVFQDGYYVKYANGVATVIIPAIQVDDEGEEASYWPERFSLESYVKFPNGEREEINYRTYTAEKVLEYEKRVAVKVEGLWERRERDPDVFQTIMQQNPPTDHSGDFTDETLGAADDDLRSWDVAFPHELIVVGVDPARTGGAAYFVWAVDRKNQTITAVDYFWGQRLGITGIKNRLVQAPIAKWHPLALCYETNREAWVLEDPEVARMIKDFGVQIIRHHTNQNRNNQVIGVPSLSFYMRSQIIRFPSQTAEDRRRTQMVKDHFKSWDAAEVGTRTKSGQGGHYPDDIAMAAWAGFVKALELMERGVAKSKRNMPVPAAVMRRWQRHRAAAGEREYVRSRENPMRAGDERKAMPTNGEAVTMLIGQEN